MESEEIELRIKELQKELRSLEKKLSPSKDLLFGKYTKPVLMVLTLAPLMTIGLSVVTFVFGSSQTFQVQQEKRNEKLSDLTRSYFEELSNNNAIPFEKVEFILYDLNRNSKTPEERKFLFGVLSLLLRQKQEYSHSQCFVAIRSIEIVPGFRDHLRNQGREPQIIALNALKRLISLERKEDEDLLSKFLFNKEEKSLYLRVERTRMQNIQEVSCLLQVIAKYSNTLERKEHRREVIKFFEDNFNRNKIGNFYETRNWEFCFEKNGCKNFL